MRRIYLDHAASTPISPEARAAMKPYCGARYGNPGSLHSFGQEALAAVDAARERTAAAIGAEFRNVVFTGSATEANNLALRGAVRQFKIKSSKLKIRPKVVVSSIEHESVLETARDLENDGVEVAVAPVDERGVVDVRKLAAALDDRTALVSVMYVNNEIGSVQPIAEIASLIAKLKIQNSKLGAVRPLLHTDASQAPAYFDCDISRLGADLMTLSSQKINGPKGVGALCARDVKKLAPIVTGGGQEFGLRSGTENVPGIVGFAVALEFATKNRKREVKKISALKEYFWQEIKKISPRAAVNGSADTPHILNVYFPDRFAGDLLTRLDIAGVAASSGSACAARAFTPSHVLAALGLPGERVRGSVRFSFGTGTTAAEIKEAARRLRKILEN